MKTVRAKTRRLTGWGVVLLFGTLLTFAGLIVLLHEAWLAYAGRPAVATVVDVTGWTNRAGRQRYTYTFRYVDQDGTEQTGWVMVPDQRYWMGEKLSITYLNGWERVDGTDGRPWTFAAMGLAVMGVAGAMRVMGIGTAPLGRK